MIIFLLLFLHFFTLEPPRNPVLAAVVAEMGACRSQKSERGAPSSLFYETMVPREDFSLSRLLTLSPLATWPWMQTQSQWCTASLGTGQPKPQHSGRRTEMEHFREMVNTGETEEKKFGIIITMNLFMNCMDLILISMLNNLRAEQIDHCPDPTVVTMWHICGADLNSTTKDLNTELTLRPQPKEGTL